MTKIMKFLAQSSHETCDKIMLVRCNLDGATLHFQSKTIRRVQKVPEQEWASHKLCSVAPGKVLIFVTGP